MNCKDCKYVHAYGPFDDEYECRKLPPVVVVRTVSAVNTQFPQVEPDEWCGEFKAHE